MGCNARKTTTTRFVCLFIYPFNAQLDCSNRMLKFTFTFTLKVHFYVNINVNFNTLLEQSNCALVG